MPYICEQWRLKLVLLDYHYCLWCGKLGSFIGLPYIDCLEHKLAKCMLPNQDRRAWLTNNQYRMSFMPFFHGHAACTSQVCAPSSCFCEQWHEKLGSLLDYHFFLGDTKKLGNFIGLPHMLREKLVLLDNSMLVMWKFRQFHWTTVHCYWCILLDHQNC